MADEVRQTQDITEILSGDSSPVRESQNVVEILGIKAIAVNHAQNIIEILSSTLIEVRMAQNIVELIPGPIDISGIYYIHPDKTLRHDSYYENEEKRIPNPTIRTALIGE